LGQVFQPLLVPRLDPYLVVNVAKKIVRNKLSYEIKISTSLKTGVMAPGHDHLDEKIIDQSFFFHHRQDICPEQLGQGPDVHLPKKINEICDNYY
jgi:hypothetical protein